MAPVHVAFSGIASVIGSEPEPSGAVWFLEMDIADFETQEYGTVDAMWFRRSPVARAHGTPHESFGVGAIRRPCHESFVHEALPLGHVARDGSGGVQTSIQYRGSVHFFDAGRVFVGDGRVRDVQRGVGEVRLEFSGEFCAVGIVASTGGTRVARAHVFLNALAIVAETPVLGMYLTRADIAVAVTVTAQTGTSRSFHSFTLG